MQAYQRDPKNSSQHFKRRKKLQLKLTQTVRGYGSKQTFKVLQELIVHFENVLSIQLECYNLFLETRSFLILHPSLKPV